MNHLRPRVVTLGTAGGPRWWDYGESGERSGIATAILVGDAAYLVDCGHGVGRRLADAKIKPSKLRVIFLTHLHSDHTVDLGSLVLFGMMGMPKVPERKIPIIGPGDRGVLPPLSSFAEATPVPPFAESPTPGTRELFETILRAYGTDLADRMFDSLRKSPFEFFEGHDIDIPTDLGFHPNDNPSPSMEPFQIYADDLVTVTATLVEHPPIAPAFAFRFDTEGGSVTISGDTAPSQNLVRLARDTDILLHEAIDFDWARSFYAGESEEVGRATIEHHEKSHTSPEQAADIANRAGARILALHHLVPGNLPAARWYEGAANFNGQLVIPDDLAWIDPYPTNGINGRDEEKVSVP